MRIRTRLLIASLASLAVGLGLLLTAGNLLFARTIDGQSRQLLVTRADTQIAALKVRPAGVSVRPTHNDGLLDGRAWVFDRHGVLERPSRLPPLVDRVAVWLGSRAVASTVRNVGEYRLKSVPLFAGTPARRVGAVVVEINVTGSDSLEHKVLLGSFAIAGILLLVLGVAVDRALRGAMRAVGNMTEAAEEWSEHDLDRRFAVGSPRARSAGWPPRWTGCLIGSLRHGVMNAASRRMLPTNCARRSLRSGRASIFPLTRMRALRTELPRSGRSARRQPG